MGGGIPVERSARGFRESFATPPNCERRCPNAATVNSPQWHRADTVLLLALAIGVRCKEEHALAGFDWQGRARHRLDGWGRAGCRPQPRRGLSLGEAGARVLVHGRDAERGIRVVADIEAAGGAATFLRADLASLAEVRRLAAAVK